MEGYSHYTTPRAALLEKLIVCQFLKKKILCLLGITRIAQLQ